MRTSCFLLISLLFLAPSLPAQKKSLYVEDVEFAVEALGEACGQLLKKKKIDWAKIGKTFLADAAKTEDHVEHYHVLNRLVCRLEDGHAEVRVGKNGKDIEWPEREPKGGPGIFLCRVKKKIYIKNAWSSGSRSGLQPGMEILAVDGVPAAKWLKARVERHRDERPFSTERAAYYHACHKGLVEPGGTRMKLDVRDRKGKRKKKNLTFDGVNQVQWGPAYFPENLDGDKDVRYAKTERGFGYIHIRRCKGNLPERMDEALAKVGDAPGLILDFRGNTGGGYDHAGFLGRFIPKGSELSFSGRTYESAGDHPYGGRMVVIIDAGSASAAETGSGMFKEEGRAYVIGEATAGMSSQKTTIELPSGIFDLYVSVRSNMSRYNKNEGIEGIGIAPHEVVEYDPRDLAAERDTMILKAEKLLRKFPQKKVPYDPKKT